VAVIDRVNIQERNSVRRFDDSSRRDLAQDDLAEDAMWIVAMAHGLVHREGYFPNLCQPFQVADPPKED